MKVLTRYIRAVKGMPSCLIYVVLANGSDQ